MRRRKFLQAGAIVGGTAALGLRPFTALANQVDDDRHDAASELVVADFVLTATTTTLLPASRSPLIAFR